MVNSQIISLLPNAIMDCKAQNNLAQPDSAWIKMNNKKSYNPPPIQIHHCSTLWNPVSVHSEANLWATPTLCNQRFLLLSVLRLTLAILVTRFCFILVLFNLFLLRIDWSINRSIDTDRIFEMNTVLLLTTLPAR